MQKIHIPRYKSAWRWIKRYGPGELCATSGALLGGYIVSQFTHNPVALGYAGAWGENICYYGYFLYKEYTDQKLFHGVKISLWSVFIGMMTEFGPGELLDSFVIKPLFMGWGSERLGIVGFIVGKYAADVIYYTIATLLYHHKTKKRVDVSLQELEHDLEGCIDQAKSQ